MQGIIYCVKLLEMLINNHVSVIFDFKHNKSHKNLVDVGDDTGEDLIDATINHINNSFEYFEVS